VALDFWRATDYLAFVDRHLDAALGGDAEAAYFVAMAQQACIPAVGRPTLSGKTEAIEAWLARRPELSDEQAASYRRRLRRCAGFLETYTSEDDAEVLAEAADALLRAAADAGHPAAIVESRMWVADGWRDGPGRDAVLDQLAGAAASGHPEALRKLGEYLGGDAGVALTVLACEAGYDCGADADWGVEFCQFGWAVCGIEADGPEALLGSLPGYRAREVRERVATLRDGTAAVFRPFLDAALGPAAAKDQPP
jgi:TPR repeat protein